MKKILITGNSGYIGSHLVKILNENNNFTIYGLDKKMPCIDPAMHLQLNLNNLEPIQFDFDYTVHLAAEVSVNESVKLPSLYYVTNTIGTLNLLKNIKTKNFIFASTGAAETLNSPYGISKRAAEQIVEEYCLQNNIAFTIFRFYNVIGSDGIPPTNIDGLMFNLLQAVRTKKFKLFGNDYNTEDGSAIRDYVHVNEICHSIISSLDNPSFQIENLGHGVGTSVQQIIKLFKKVNAVDFDVEIMERRQGDAPISVLDKPSVYMKKIYNLEELLKI